ncbi:hypothetical protein [Nodosilinea nodulosa]|uniref:hypothetical protein n=1 Tax=Nodosilinea nodulosa TaxID=416001 RepID=UPI0002FD6F89|nr:hypothetical protein [Nodosilinea nodulosa]
MTDPCRNDCPEPLGFPKRLFNRPGLSQIDYRIGTYADIRAALLRQLDADPLLQAWTHREADDPGIALLEGAAILGDILTFYQNLYANEAFLRTAKWRESIADLVRLTGYLLSPGLGGRATFAVGLKGEKPVTVPAGFGLKAQVEGLPKIAEFQTENQITAYPALSQFHLHRPFQLPSINNGTSRFSIETATLKNAGLELQKGDRLFLADVPTNPQTKRQIVVVKEIQERFDRTEITIEGSWQQNYAGYLVNAYKLGRSFRHFGYNGPPEFVQLQGDKAVSTAVNFSRQMGPVPGIFILLLGGYSPLSSFKAMPLDTQVDDLTVGTTLLVQLILNSQRSLDGRSVSGDTYFFEREIQRVTQASVTRGAISGGTTVVELDANLTTSNLAYTDIRSVEMLEVLGQRFTLQSAYQEKPESDLRTLFFFGNFASYKQLNNRPIAFQKSAEITEVLIPTIPSDQLIPDDQIKLRPLSLPEFKNAFEVSDFPLLSEPAVTVYGNLVEATQGKREKEAVLGNGDGRQSFQTFKLPKAPLTYLPDTSATPPEVPELEVFVGDRRWTQVQSFFGQSPKAEIYIVREDAKGESWVQFGDGKTGARLPSGVKNIKALYRTGTGAYGALKPDTKVQAIGRLTGLDQLWLPGVASGGTEPESGDNARVAAPGKLQSLGRLVSLQDFESEAIAIAGVSKAAAAWQLVDNLPSVVLTVLMESGRETEFEAVRGSLATANRCRGPQRFPVLVKQGQVRYLYLRLVVSPHPAFRQDLLTQAIQMALGTSDSHGLFGLGDRQFGQREYATRIEATVQQVEGVVWTQVEALGWFSATEKPAELPYPSSEKNLAVVPCGADQVLGQQGQHLQIQFVAAPQEDC